MKVAIVIPARFQSSRYPGKPLIDILGTSMIERVHQKCKESKLTNNVYVATDDYRIIEHCEKHGIKVILTSESCLTGTDRVFEASKHIDADYLVNVQGDEPLISPKDIDRVIYSGLQSPETIVNAMSKIREEDDFRNPNIPKVTVGENGYLMYMSRAAIPTSKKLEFGQAWKQVCIYGLPKALLQRYGAINRKTSIEQIEDIEILRFLEIGVKVKMVETYHNSIAIDTPDDRIKVIEHMMSNDSNYG